MTGEGLPVMTAELARRIDGAAGRFMLAWLEGIARRPGNPTGMEIERFAEAAAPLSKAKPELDFMNRVIGLYPEEVNQVDEIVARYRNRGIRGWFELIPGPDVERLIEGLTAAGAAQVGFHGALYGPARRPPTADADAEGVRVRRIDRTELDTFAAINPVAFEIPAEEQASARANLAHWADVPEWRLYLAEVDGEHAATAVLSLGDGIGYLASAGTLPAHRGRGCHTALLRRRIADAAEEGCELVTGLAAFGSVSQHNMERVGLRPAYTSAVWRMLPA